MQATLNNIKKHSFWAQPNHSPFLCTSPKVILWNIQKFKQFWSIYPNHWKHLLTVTPYSTWLLSFSINPSPLNILNFLMVQNNKAPESLFWIQVNELACQTNIWVVGGVETTHLEILKGFPWHYVYTPSSQPVMLGDHVSRDSVCEANTLPIVVFCLSVPFF